MEAIRAGERSVDVVGNRGGKARTAFRPNWIAIPDHGKLQVEESAMPAAVQSQTAPQPLSMRWTVEQFNHMGDLGWFEGRRPFLIDGVIWEQGPMDTPHATGLSLVDEAIRPLFTSGWYLRIQMPFHVDEFNDPFPDLAVVPGLPRDYANVHPTQAVLVVEVSDTTLRTDTTLKAERYATAGVGDYWVLDLTDRKLLVFRDPVRLPAGLGVTAYRTQITLNPTDRVSPLAAPSASILVADLLP
jgi:Uma2 family endonuclease